MKRVLLVPFVAVALSCGDSATDPLTNDDFAAALNVDLNAMVRTASGLYHQDLQVVAGEEAVSGATVTVDYKGWLADGTKFDSSIDRGQPFTFQLGLGSVTAAWDEGVQGIRVGGVRKLVIPPSLAYGSAGIPPTISGNATLVFDVELLEVVP